MSVSPRSRLQLVTMRNEDNPFQMSTSTDEQWVTNPVRTWLRIYANIYWLYGLELSIHHFLVSKKFKSIYAAVLVINYFTHYNRFPSDGTAQNFYYTNAIPMLNDLASYILYFPLLQAFTAKLNMQRRLGRAPSRFPSHSWNKKDVPLEQIFTTKFTL